MDNFPGNDAAGKTGACHGGADGAKAAFDAAAGTPAGMGRDAAWFRAGWLAALAEGESSRPEAEPGWRCGACGYVSREDGAPETCPVCTSSGSFGPAWRRRGGSHV